MYWLMRSASCPPVSVVSPRNSTGLSLLRLRATTVRWPECRGWRSSSSVIAPKTRTCYRTSCRAPVKSAASGLVGLGPVPGRDLLGEVGPPLDLLLDPGVVEVELLGFGNAAHL